MHMVASWMPMLALSKLDVREEQGDAVIAGIGCYNTECSRMKTKRRSAMRHVPSNRVSLKMKKGRYYVLRSPIAAICQL